MDKTKELAEIYRSLYEAKLNNISDYPYSKMQTSFNSKLKELLKETFGENIKFDREETFAYIQAHYKGIGIEINTYDGIIFSIEDETKREIIADFENIFNEIVGMSKFTQYDYCSKVTKTTYPTTEWNKNPDRRLNDLICRHGITPGEYITNFNDYYTSSIIEGLGDELLTSEGYKLLFSTTEDFSSYWYKRRLIATMCPHISSLELYKWLEESKNETPSPRR